MEFKQLGQGFKDIDVKKGIVTGYFSAFGSKDSDGDIIMPGAFAKSISENGPDSKNPRVKHLLDHDRKHAVAKINVLKEDATGLYYESKAGSHNNGQDFLKMVEDGIITEHSIGFDTIKEQQKSDANYMSELHLWEGSSLQCWGANSNTPIVGVKSLEDIIVGVAKINKALKDGKYTDETFIQLSTYLQRIEKKLKLEAGSSTSDSNKSIYSLFI